MFLRGAFGTLHAIPSVHHLPWTHRTSIHRLVVVLLRRVLRLIVGLLLHVHRQPWCDSVADLASVVASACSRVAAPFGDTMHLNPPIGCCVSPPRSPCTSSHRWIVVCIHESESPNVTASASSHVAASVAASAASSVASSDNVPSDVEPSVHSHPWEAPMTTLLRLIVVLFCRAPCHPITAPIAASAATSDISYVASSATPYVAAFVEVPAAYPVKSHAAPSVACPATSSAESHVAPSVAAFAASAVASSFAAKTITTIKHFKGCPTTASLEASSIAPCFLQHFRPTSFDSTPSVPRSKLLSRALLSKRIVICDDGTASEGDSSPEEAESNVDPACLLPSREEVNNKASESERARHLPLDVDASESLDPRHPPAAVPISNTSPGEDDTVRHGQCLAIPETAREGEISCRCSINQASLGPHDVDTSASHADKRRHIQADHAELPITSRAGETISRSCNRASAGPPDNIASRSPSDDNSKNNLLTLCSHEVDVLCWRCYAIHLPFKVSKTMAEVGLLPKRIMSARDPRGAKYLQVKIMKANQTPAKIAEPGPSICIACFEPDSTIYLNGIHDTDSHQRQIIFDNHHSDTEHVYFYAKKYFESFAFEVFARTKLLFKINVYHTFECQFYDGTCKDEPGTSASAFYSNESIIGIYLGPVPCYRRNISLVHSMKTSTDPNSNSTSTSTCRASPTTFTSTPTVQAHANHPPSFNINSATTASLQSTSISEIFTSENEPSRASSRSISSPCFHPTLLPTSRPPATSASSRPNVSFRGRQRNPSPKTRESLETNDLKTSILASLSTFDAQHYLPSPEHQVSIFCSQPFLPVIVVDTKHFIEPIFDLIKRKQTFGTRFYNPFSTTAAATRVAVLVLTSHAMKLLSWFYDVFVILAYDSFIINCISKYRRDTTNIGTRYLRDPNCTSKYYADARFSVSWLLIYAANGTPVLQKSRSAWRVLTYFSHHDYLRFYCKYRSCIKQLLYVARSERSDIIFTVHQFAHLLDNIKCSSRHTIGNPDLAIEFLSHSKQFFERHDNHDFSSILSNAFSETGTPSNESRYGFIMTYVQCTISASMSTPLTTYIALPSCTLEITLLPKMHPRTKTTVIKYHYFREYVRLRLIKNYHTSTTDQVADIFTKPLTQNPFVKHRVKICGT